MQDSTGSRIQSMEPLERQRLLRMVIFIPPPLLLFLTLVFILIFFLGLGLAIRVFVTVAAVLALIGYRGVVFFLELLGGEGFLAGRALFDATEVLTALGGCFLVEGGALPFAEA